jgi:hypothetical protein
MRLPAAWFRPREQPIVHKRSDFVLPKHRTLQQAVEDGQLLLAYAARAGLGVDQGLVKTIVNAKTFLDDGAAEGASNEAEAEFWSALDKLARHVRPASIASIRATTELYQDQSVVRYWTSFFTRRGSRERLVSDAIVAVRRTRFWSLVWLFVLLLAQIYWVIGSTVTKDIPNLLKKADELVEAKSGLKKKAIAEKREPADDPEIQELEAELDKLNEEMGTNYEILEKWNRVWQIPVSLLGRIEKPLSGGSPTNTFTNAPLPYTRLQKSLITAQFTLTAMTLYLLPLLYGLLGAFTFVLRSLSIETQRLTYSRASNTKYRLRIYMGALAGLVVVWFVPVESAQTSTTFLKALTPLALAFLAGYSVEILFAGLDRLVNAFTHTEAERPSR